MFQHFRRMLAITSVVLAISGCDLVDTMNQSLEYSRAVSRSIESKTGLKSEVGFEWQTGSLTSVTVNFVEMPEKHTIQELSAISKQAILTEFKQKPEHVVLTFVIK